MLKSDGRLFFGEWLPDLPLYENPGLTVARNVIPIDRHYAPYRPIASGGSALAAKPLTAFVAVESDGSPEIYAGTATDLYERFSGTWTARSAATYGASRFWSFAQYKDLVIATDYEDVPQTRTVGSASSFTVLSTTGTAPSARHVGVIGQFVMLGDTNDAAGTIPYRVRWSAIDDPRHWPTPNTASATAVQAGAEELNSLYGPITGIANGEFWGLVFQQRAVTRFTYVGGDIVFQVQTLDRTRGCWAPRSLIQVGDLTYYLAADGFYVTDGQTVRSLDQTKTGKWFLTDFDLATYDEVTAAHDPANKCLFWSYPRKSSAGRRVMVFNYAEDRWSYAEDTAVLYFSGYTESITLEQLSDLHPNLETVPESLDSSVWLGGTPQVFGFTSDYKLGTPSGAPLDATLETGEVDLNPFGYAFIRGVRPLVTGSPKDLAVSIAVRGDQDLEYVGFGHPQSRTPRTGVCDFRETGRYVSARLEIEGTFERAVGLQVDFELDGHA